MSDIKVKNTKPAKTSSEAPMVLSNETFFDFVQRLMEKEQQMTVPIPGYGKRSRKKSLKKAAV